MCWPTATLEANKALLAKRLEETPYHDGQFESWSKKRSNTHPFHYLDGVSIWVSREEPGEDYSDFLGLLGRDAAVTDTTHEEDGGHEGQTQRAEP